MAANKTKDKARSGSNRVLTVIGAILCIILIPILVINCTMIVKSYISPDKVPGFGKTTPMIVMTDSMYPYIKSGDLILCRTTDAADVKTGDVISFFDPEGNGTSVVTHRVTEIVTGDGTLQFRTKGDANNTEDKTLVPAESLVGVYRSRIGGMGSVALFMQTTPGLIVCVGLPIILLVGYDMIRRRMYERSRKVDTDALMAELEALRAAQNAGTQPEAQPEEQPAEND